MNYWIWLSQLPGVGPVLQKRLLEAFITPENIHESSLADLIEVEGIGQNLAKKILEFRVNRIFSIKEKVEKLGIKIVTSQSDRFKEVFSCKRSPVLFFYRGELPKERGIAIVGSRRCTEDAKRSAEEIARNAAQAGVTVVSGLAKGIDSYAHTACLKNGGKTIAVLGCGVDICYPPEHKSLYDRIVGGGGAVLSAYPPGMRPHPKFFLERNAHISAWSTDVVVVQAATKSGALTTSAFAQEQARNLYVVPHSIYLPEARGSNLLLEQGARPYLGPHSLPIMTRHKNVEVGMPSAVDTSSPTPSPFQAPPNPLSALEKRVVNSLQRSGHSTVEQLAHTLAIAETELTPTLSLMEMSDLILIKGTTVSLLTGATNGSSNGVFYLSDRP
ncbi:DNA-processing protein DprA [Bacillaceae bacterium IKA-2]|nr:DNA-processing protein DprA [Bacillaceae bacterium IKA-2]